MIRIVAVGKIKEKALSQLIAEYVKRLSAFTRVEIIEVADEHAPQSNSDAENELVKEREGERVLSRIKEGEYVILLDLWGKMYDSERFAQRIDTLQVQEGHDLRDRSRLGPPQWWLQRSALEMSISPFRISSPGCSSSSRSTRAHDPFPSSLSQ
ncbi:MAG: 23S rRNA (pseudouridine(1915)-N(3))-methyltransferase RlmH [Merdibacter sp.]